MSKNTRSKNLSKLIILALVLFVPGFLYILVNKMGSNEYLKLPVFGEKKLSGEMRRVMGREIPDTIFHQLKPVEFINYDNKPVTLLGNDSSVSVVHLFYTRDQGLSKQLVHDMSAIATRFKENPKVQLFSVSVDPHDTAEDLKKFIEPYKKGMSSHWYVVNKPSVDIFEFARSSMLIEAMPVEGDSTKFIISNQFVLLDSEKRIRGFYDISLRSELDRLEDEIKVQLVEEVRNNPLKVERK